MSKMKDKHILLVIDDIYGEKLLTDKTSVRLFWKYNIDEVLLSSTYFYLFSNNLIVFYHF